MRKLIVSLLLSRPAIKLYMILLIMLYVAAAASGQTKYLLKDKFKDNPCGLLQIYKEPSGAIWYDSMVKCTTVIIRTKFGHLRSLHKLPYFYLRYQVLYSGKINPYSYKFFYPNRKNEINVVWWTSSPVPVPEWY